MSPVAWFARAGRCWRAVATVWREKGDCWCSGAGLAWKLKGDFWAFLVLSLRDILTVVVLFAIENHCQCSANAAQWFQGCAGQFLCDTGQLSMPVWIAHCKLSFRVLWSPRLQESDRDSCFCLRFLNLEQDIMPLNWRLFLDYSQKTQPPKIPLAKPRVPINQAKAAKPPTDSGSELLASFEPPCRHCAAALLRYHPQWLNFLRKFCDLTCRQSALSPAR